MVAVGGAKRKIFSSPTSSSVVIPKRLLKEQKPKKSLEKRDEKKKRAHVMREWIFQRRRRSSSDQHRMIRENSVTEGEYYFRFIRMSPGRFEHLLSIVGPKLMQKRTSIQDLMADSEGFSSLADRFFLERMLPAERLTLTLRFLATGECQESLSLSLGMSETVIRDIVSDTCVNLWDSLSAAYVQPPRSDEDWIEISDQFYVLTGIVHCLGAVDAKQIMLETPTHTNGPTPSLYHNYDRFFNLLLISSCDAHYCFNLIDIGSHGTDADDVLDNSEMGMRFEAGKMNVPAPEELAGCQMSELPYFLVGDGSFPLKDWLMKPYPGSISRSQKIFNCRIARAQRFIENSNGILAARWRVYREPLRASVDEAQKISLATIGLHNYLMMTETPSYCPRGFVDSADVNGGIVRGMWRDIVEQDEGRCALQPVPHTNLVSRIDTFAMSQREALSAFFMQEEAANYKREQTEIERFRSRTTSENGTTVRQSKQFVL
jgi:hypothetical protein